MMSSPGGWLTANRIFAIFRIVLLHRGGDAWPTSALAWALRACSLTIPMAGKSRPMRIAMMVITVSNSMRVNASRKYRRWGREFIGKTFRGKLLESSVMTTEKLLPAVFRVRFGRLAEEGFLGAKEIRGCLSGRRVPLGRFAAVVVLTHGLGEHSSRYGHVAAALVERGLQVSAWDLRGHGRSSGPRGDVTDYDLLVEDLAAVCAHFRVKGRPLFLFAHSLGAQITLSYLERQDAECDGARDCFAVAAAGL